MSKPIDVRVKTQKPNHLASRYEKLASAGATIPKRFVKQFERLHQLSLLAQRLLSPVLGDTLALSCRVVLDKDGVLTIVLPTITAVNHARLLHQSCLDALHAHETFAIHQQIRFVCTQQNTSSTHRNNTKKPLSENTKQTITQFADIVITDQKLLTSVHRLIKHAKVADDDDV